MHTHVQLLIAIAFLFATGLVMIFNTTSAEVLDWNLECSTHQALFKQFAYGVLGCISGWGLWHIGYKRVLKSSPFVLLVLTVLLVLCFVPGIGITRNGARRWIMIAGIGIQPSEFVKYATAFFYIYVCTSQIDLKFTLKNFLKTLAFLAVPVCLILLEPNNGTAAVTVITLVMLFFLSGVKFRFWGIPIICFGLVALTIASQLSYIKGRVYSYMHPEVDLKGKGHQPWQAKIAAGSGGALGKGPGKSLQKLSYLPEAQNDYIAAIFAEEYGFLGVFLLISIYAWITFLGFRIACLAPDQRGLYTAATITFLISFQAFLNLGVVSGLLPSTGLNLPFFSQGGSSLIAHLSATGILLNICYEGNKVERLIS